jgi:hypothetical protein
MNARPSLRDGVRAIVFLGVSLGFSLLAAQAQVLEGGFENLPPGIYTGNIGYGWMATQGTITILASGMPSGVVAHTGNQFADLDYSYTLNTLAQRVTVVPNQSYILSYWVADNSPDPLTVTFDGIVLFNGTAPTGGVGSPDDYVQYLFTVTPSSSTPLLTFTGHYTGPGGTVGTILDDVSLTPVPEPPSLLQLAFGATVAVMTALRRTHATKPGTQ